VSFKTLFGLIFCNFIWSAHPMMGKYLMLGFSPEQGAWLRYASALLAYSLAVGVSRVFAKRGLRALLGDEPFFVPRTARDASLLFLLGFAAFCFSPLLQMTGLSSSRATDNSLIVALEPLMTVLLAWLVLKERPTRVHFIAFGVALAGFALLTGLGPAAFSNGLEPHLLGNLLMLASLVGEALYSAIGRKLIVRHPPTAVFGSAIVFGVICLTAFTQIRTGLPTWQQCLHMPWQSAIALLWLGPFGTALSYLFWMRALSAAPVASIALTLFIQPVLGPLWGGVFLGERLSVMQCLGSGLILVAVFGQTWAEVRRSNIQ
jgi:drug/metabolite transporter (DMT)-like permease